MPFLPGERGAPTGFILRLGVGGIGVATEGLDEVSDLGGMDYGEGKIFYVGVTGDYARFILCPAYPGVIPRWTWADRG